MTYDAPATACARITSTGRDPAAGRWFISRMLPPVPPGQCRTDSQHAAARLHFRTSSSASWSCPSRCRGTRAQRPVRYACLSRSPLRASRIGRERDLRIICLAMFEGAYGTEVTRGDPVRSQGPGPRPRRGSASGFPGFSSCAPSSFPRPCSAWSLHRPDSSSHSSRTPRSFR